MSSNLYANPPKYQIATVSNHKTICGLSVPRFHESPSPTAAGPPAAAPAPPPARPPRILQNTPRECSRSTNICHAFSVTCHTKSVTRVSVVVRRTTTHAWCFRGFAAGAPAEPDPPLDWETRGSAALTIRMISYFGGFDFFCGQRVAKL